MNDWIHLALHIITLHWFGKFMNFFKNIRKVQNGEIGDEKRQKFATELLKRKDDQK